VAAASLGRTGVVATTAEVSAWAWTALGAAVVLLLASLVSAVAARTWSGLSSRFDAPREEAGATANREGVSPATPAPTGRGTKPSAWDELSEGRDPTVEASDGSPHEERST
jgi:uncharacterized membrane protein (TIGR02234 family)